jgi:hypothetical protein
MLCLAGYVLAILVLVLIFRMQSVSDAHAKHIQIKERK